MNVELIIKFSSTVMQCNKKLCETTPDVFFSFLYWKINNMGNHLKLMKNISIISSIPILNVRNVLYIKCFIYDILIVLQNVSKRLAVQSILRLTFCRVNLKENRQSISHCQRTFMLTYVLSKQNVSGEKAH